MENDLSRYNETKSLGPLIYRDSTGQGISFLRFLRVCVFFALLEKEFSQKQNKKAPAQIVSNKRRNFQSNCKLENQTSTNAKFSSSQKNISPISKISSLRKQPSFGDATIGFPPSDV